jgi:hypothetical protein
MSIYSNSVTVGMAEMGRLTFHEVNNGNTETVAQLVIPHEVFKNMIAIMQQTVDAFERQMAEQKEANRKLS